MENFRIALVSIGINRLRAALTALGIVIGVGAVVALISLGDGVSRSVTSQFSSLGTTTVTVSSRRPRNATGRAVQHQITSDEAAAIAKLPAVSEISSIYQVNATVRAGEKSSSANVSGVEPNYITFQKYTMGIGSFIAQSDIDQKSRVAVLGQGIVDDLWGSTTYDAVGQELEINGQIFTVIGILAPTGFGTDNYLFVPLPTAQSRLANARVQGGGYALSQVQALAISDTAVNQAIAEITEYMMKAHEITSVNNEDFNVSSPSTILDTVSQVTGTLTIFLGIVAGISLLVGGIGIMNIMLVSVTERTREIGLRKAVGARGQDILMQFLIESLVLSFIGGALGIGLGEVVMLIGNRIAPTLNLYLTTNSVVLATVVCSMIGILFGLLPASRAARMRPIQALRYE